MSTHVSERSVFDWRCDQCGRRETCSVLADAQTAAEAHAAFHVTSALLGPALASRVLDTDRTVEVPWFGFITKANDYAKEHGYPFFVWNGWVHPVDSVNLDKPLCYAHDVPGTRASERAA